MEKRKKYKLLQLKSQLHFEQISHNLLPVSFFVYYTKCVLLFSKLVLFLEMFIYNFW